MNHGKTIFFDAYIKVRKIENTHLREMVYYFKLKFQILLSYTKSLKNKLYNTQYKQKILHKQLCVSVILEGFPCVMMASSTMIRDAPQSFMLIAAKFQLPETTRFPIKIIIPNQRQKSTQFLNFSSLSNQF